MPYLALPHDLPRIEYLHYDSLHSTTTDFYTLPWQQHTPPRLAVAEYQTAGRGQQGTHWEANAGENLLFTLEILPKHLPATNQFALSIIAALAAYDCCAPLLIAETLTLKWPNDLYYGDHKLGGILIQHTLEGAHIARTLVGVGLNINQPLFTSNAPNPISLYQITGQTHEREPILHHFLTAFFTRLACLEQSHTYATTLWHTYHQHLYRREGIHRYRANATDFSAEILKIDQLGRLHLRHTDGNTKAYAFKEVAYILP